MNNDYVGPKAIFDPNFIPPTVLFRKKEQNSLISILSDSFSDQYSLNILYQGIDGIGKKVIINKVLNDLLTNERDSYLLAKITIDCKDKNLEELIFSLLAELNKTLNFNFDLNNLVYSNVSQLWNILKLASKKFENSFIMIFNNIEYIDPALLKKILHLGKEAKITIISTINKILRTSSYDYLAHFDIKKKLSYYTFNELNLILQKRASLAFSHEIDQELIYFITDLIFEHYVPVPGKGIDIFREIYPFLKSNELIEYYKMLEICQNQFDSFQITDEFHLYDYICEEDPLILIFLDNLCNKFLKKSNYYININELKEIYRISCESLEYDKNVYEFNNLIKTMQKIGFLCQSKRTSSDRTHNFSKNSPYYNYFFMIINPYQVKSLIDTIFNNS